MDAITGGKEHNLPGIIGKVDMLVFSEEIDSQL